MNLFKTLFLILVVGLNASYAKNLLELFETMEEKQQYSLPDTSSPQEESPTQVPIVQSPIAPHIQMLLNAQNESAYKSIVSSLYQQSGYAPFWVEPKDTQRRLELMNALENPLYNYKNKSFDLSMIKGLYFELDSGAVPKEFYDAYQGAIDLLLTNSFVRLSDFVWRGDIDWGVVQNKIRGLKRSEGVNAHWEMTTKPMIDSATLYQAIQSDSIKASFNDLLPLKERYRSLVVLLQKYRKMEAFPQIPYRLPQPTDVVSEVVLKIKKRLQITGEYPKNAPLDGVYDAALLKAVERFQDSHNINKENGIDNITLYYLNQPNYLYINQIITNLDKMKLYPSRFEADRIEANVPEFTLHYYRGGKERLESKLVVGRLDRPTPLFKDEMEFMTLNPTWTVPNNLIVKDLIPVLKTEPNYLHEHHIKVYQGNKEIEVNYAMLSKYDSPNKTVPYRFVQMPGEENALGKVKFMFPNPHLVYLHDTDNKELFNHRYRVYSSGCMRVQKQFELMKQLLPYSPSSYSKNQLDKIFQSNTPSTIKFKNSIPMHILYFTVVQKHGIDYFMHDIYLYDQMIQESVRGVAKTSFMIPKNRMISVDQNGQTHKQTQAVSN